MFDIREVGSLDGRGRGLNCNQGLFRCVLSCSMLAKYTSYCHKEVDAVDIWEFLLAVRSVNYRDPDDSGAPNKESACS